MWWMYEIKRAKRLSQAFVHVVTARPSLFRDEKYQVFQYAPSTSISEQFERILLTILPRISILLLWNDGHQCMELILCRVAESSCSPTHNIVPHTSWHDLPYRRTTKKYTDFLSTVIFQLLLRKFWIQTLQNNLRGYFWQFSCWSHFFFFELMVIHAWCCDFENCWVVLFANSQYLSTHFFAWLSMSQDQEDTVSASRFPEALVGRSLWLQQKSWIRNYCCNYPQYPCWSDILFECNPNKHGHGMMLVLSNQRLPWEFSKSVLCLLSCLPVWYRPHTLIRMVLLLGWQINIPSLKLFPNRVPTELSQIAFP